MKSQIHRPREGQDKGKPGAATKPRDSHPLLHLQQLVGNKVVSRMIQRETLEQEGGAAGASAKDGEFKDLKVQNLDVSGTLKLGGKAIQPVTGGAKATATPKSQKWYEGWLFGGGEKGRLSNRGSGIR